MLSLGAGLAGCGSSEIKSKVNEPISVTVQKVQSDLGAEEFEYSGSLEADNTVDMSFSVSGRIKEVRVEEGQHILKGTQLASIEATKYSSAFAIAEAEYVRAADQYERSKELYDRGSLPERDFIAATSVLTRAKANKEIAAKDLSDVRLLAPFTGVVTDKITEVGALTAPGQPAFTLSKTNVMFATADIAEGDIAHIHTGDSVAVFIPALNEQRLGEINILNPKADDYSRTFRIKVKLPNEDGKILPGMLSQIHIYTRIPQNIIAIPTTCVLKDVDNIAYVFLLQADHTVMKRRIVLGRAKGVDEVIVSAGLKPGDQLVVSGHSRLEDGSDVQL